MFSLVEFFVVGGLFLFGFMFLTNSKIRRRVFSLWSRKSNEVADQLGDAVTDTRYAVSQAEVQVEDFENKLAEAMAKLKVAKNEHANCVADAEKYAKIAQNAIDAGDDVRAKQALGKKQAAEKRAVAILGETQRNGVMVEELRARLSHRKDEVQDAKSDISMQEARLIGLHMRESMLAAASSFGDSSQDLTAARKSLDEYEARLDAKAELSGGNDEELERLYCVNTSVDEELAKMKAAKEVKPVKVGV